MGRYYCTEDFLKSRVEETGLSVWRGYKVSVVPINSKPYLQVDVCSRVLREENFLRTIE